MTNPYLPNITVIKKIISENEVNDIKTFELVFEDQEIAKNFKYRPGQFAEVSFRCWRVSYRHSLVPHGRRVPAVYH